MSGFNGDMSIAGGVAFLGDERLRFFGCFFPLGIFLGYSWFNRNFGMPGLLPATNMP
jgi:hypothetical protein